MTDEQLLEIAMRDRRVHAENASMLAAQISEFLGGSGSRITDYKDLKVAVEACETLNALSVDVVRSDSPAVGDVTRRYMADVLRTKGESHAGYAEDAKTETGVALAERGLPSH